MELNNTTTPKTPREINAELKLRLKNVHKRLPINWISCFVWKFPQYAEMKQHISNVAGGRSLDKDVILLMEDFANLLSPDIDVHN